MRTIRPDLAHVLSEPWGLMTLQALRYSIPVTVHGAETRYGQGGPVERRVRTTLARTSLSRVAGFVGWGNPSVDAARSAGLHPSLPTAVVPAVVPPESLLAIQPRAERPHGEQDQLRIGFLGLFAPQKGLRWLVEAYELVSDNINELHLYGGTREQAEGALGQGLPQDVKVHGAIGLDKIGDALGTLDILVVPSIDTDDWVEQFGRVALEGLMAGVPVVCSDSGALPDVVGAAGVIVPQKDVFGLSRALARLKRQPGLRRELSHRGRDRARTLFSPDSLALRLVEFWAAARQAAGGRS